MASDMLKEEEITRIFDEAESAASDEMDHNFDAYVDGACIAVIPPQSDRCREMTARECAYVDRKLRERNPAWSAHWEPGPCPI